MSFSLSEFIPVWVVELAGAAVALVVAIGLVYKLLQWKRIINPLLTNGGSRQSGYVNAFLSALKLSITQRDVITDSLTRLVMHQLIFWGFILCGVATTLVWLTGTAEKARAFTDIPKVFGNVGGILLLIGTMYLLFRLVGSSSFRRNRTLGDLAFLIYLFLVTVTGFTTQYFRMAGDSSLALVNYYIHLTANILLLATAPFTHFIHAITTPLMRMIAILYPGRLIYKEKLNKIADDVITHFEEERKTR